MPVIDPTEELIRILRRRGIRGRSRVWLSPENRAALFGKVTPSAPEPSRTAPNRAVERRAAPPPRVAPMPPPPPQSVPSVQPTPTPEPAIPDAVPIANLDLAALSAVVAACRKCELHRTRTQPVFGEGDPHARLMFVGEGPGFEEDQAGRPFVGAAGQLLDRMIAAMQFRRQEVYIANVVKCRPPQNRIPEPAEGDTCMPYLARQIELIRPDVIVLLGNTPLRHVLGMAGITRLRGTWQEYKGIPVMPTFHPAFLLRHEPSKKDVWADLQAVMHRLGKDPRNTPRTAAGAGRSGTETE